MATTPKTLTTTPVNGFVKPDDVPALAKEKLASSGLTMADASKLGITMMTADETQRAELWRTGLPALWFQYHDARTGQPIREHGKNVGRARCLRQPVPKQKKFPKYVQTLGTAPHAYFPKSLRWTALLDDPKQDLIITEGELKAALACKLDFPTVAIGGVSSWRSQTARIKFLPELETIVWAGRRAYIIFDSETDPETNRKVERQLQLLANQLIQRGAEVLRVNLPTLSADGKKTGLDDFLVAKGKDGPAALRELMNDAEPMKLAWKLFYQFGKSGPVVNASNCGIALEHAPELKDCFKWDDMAETSVLAAPLPGMDADEKLPRPVSDQDALIVQRWLQREGGLISIGKETVRDAIELRAAEQHFHPIRDRLDGLVWKGKFLMKSWLKIYLGATNNPEYLEIVGRKILISMVARVYEPGCQQDHTPMLEDFQGAGKSTVVRLLAGDDRFYSDSLPEIGQDEVRTASHLAGNWVIELGELSALRKTDQETLKSFLTKRSDKFRPVWAHKEIDRPRQCVFFGTTNKRDYLKDPTGARRFWPIACTKIDPDGLKEVLDQLFAEAVVAYKAGEKWWPDKATEDRLFRPEQDARFAGVPYQELIEEWLIMHHLDEWVEMDRAHAGFNQKFKKTEGDRSRITNTVIGMRVLGFATPSAINRTQNSDITLSMERLGWRLGRYNGLPRWQPTEPILRERAKAIIAEVERQAAEVNKTRKARRQKTAEVVPMLKPLVPSAPPAMRPTLSTDEEKHIAGLHADLLLWQADRKREQELAVEARKAADAEMFKVGREPATKQKSD